MVNPLRGQFSGDLEDYRIYLAAATALARHGDIYAPFIHQTSNVQLTGFDYPPLVAWLMQPLTWMPAQVASALWVVLLVASTAAAVTLVVRELLPASWPRLELAGLLTFVFAAATYNYWHGNMNSVLFLLLALALRSWMRGHPVRTGVLIGLAASIKLAPVVLIILLLRARWWRGALAAALTIAAGGGAGIALVGVASFREWLTGVLPVLTQQDGWLTNQSLNGAVSRLFAHDVLVPQPNSVISGAVTAALSLAAVGMLVVSATPDARTRPLRGAQFGVGVLAMLLAGSLAWYAHFVSALIPLIAAAGLVAHARSRRALPVAIASIAFLVVNAVVAPVLLALVGSWTNVVSLSHSPLWYPMTQLASLPSLSAAALLITMAAYIRREANAGGADNKKRYPATTYSPTPLPGQYHRRWWA